MAELSQERFRGLALSSPWRWRALRAVVRWRGDNPTSREPVRAWVRRPDALRVETLGGEVLEAGVQDRNGRVLLTSDGNGLPVLELDPLDPRAPAPELDAEGLVVRRPSMQAGVAYDDPMFRNYRWVAMLDPAELATCTAASRQAVDHHGRPAWEAVLQPTEDYDPRCTCCPLLHSASSDRALAAASGDATWPHRQPGFRYADAHRVRLDLETGICVLTEELGGSRSGAGHEALVEAVDEAMPAELFVDRRRRRRRWWR